MVIFKFLDGVTADTTGGVWTVDTESYSSVTVQVSVTTTGTVIIQGRIPGITSWATLNDDPITTTMAVDIKAMPEMRAVSTGVSGALYVYGVGSVARAYI